MNSSETASMLSGLESIGNQSFRERACDRGGLMNANERRKVLMFIALGFLLVLPVRANAEELLQECILESGEAEMAEEDARLLGELICESIRKSGEAVALLNEETGSDTRWLITLRTRGDTIAINFNKRWGQNGGKAITRTYANFDEAVAAAPTLVRQLEKGERFDRSDRGSRQRRTDRDEESALNATFVLNFGANWVPGIETTGYTFGLAIFGIYFDGLHVGGDLDVSFGDAYDVPNFVIALNMGYRFFYSKWVALHLTAGIGFGNTQASQGVQPIDPDEISGEGAGFEGNLKFTAQWFSGFPVNLVTTVRLRLPAYELEREERSIAFGRRIRRWYVTPLTFLIGVGF